MAIVTETIHTHKYKAVRDDGFIYTCALNLCVDPSTRVVSELVVLNPGPRAVRVIAEGPKGTRKTDAVVPPRAFAHRIPLRTGRQIRVSWAAHMPEWKVSISEF